MMLVHVSDYNVYSYWTNHIEVEDNPKEVRDWLQSHGISSYLVNYGNQVFELDQDDGVLFKLRWG